MDQADRGREPQPIAHGERLDPLVRELAVGDRDDGAVERADPRRPQADLLDRADKVVQLDEVALTHRLVDADRERAEQVLERLLRRERDGEAADAEAGDQAGDRDPELRQGDDAARSRGR